MVDYFIRCDAGDDDGHGQGVEQLNAKLREETVRTIAKATELFVEHLAHEAFKHARRNKRKSKTLGYQDVCLAIGGSPTFGFLQDVIAPQPSQSKRQNTGSG